MEMISWIRSPKLFRYIYPRSRWICWLKQGTLFSFDDGPGPNTNSLLDLAQKYGVQFAFFILPEQAEKYPEIISRIVSESHIIGSHFMRHRNHILDTKTIFLNSLNESVQEIESISNTTIRYCRIPYGHLLPCQDKWISQSGYKHVFWSLDSKDYKREPTEKIIDRIQNAAKERDIILLHDGLNCHPEIYRIVEESLKFINFI